MKSLRSRFERFCLKNRDKGIPNLMLYIAIGSGIVYLLSMFNGGSALYSWLMFDKQAILQGQVWRLFSYVFTYAPGSQPFLVLIGLYFFYHLGRRVELSMGTFRFNLFYFSGMLLMAAFAMIFCPTEPVSIGGLLYPPEIFTYSIYSEMGLYLHLSLLLTFAVSNPDAQFLALYFIPVKAWFMGIVYLVLVGISVFNMGGLFPHNLFPLVGLANFLLFAGRDVVNLLPESMRPKARHPFNTAKPKRTGTMPFAPRHIQSGPVVRTNAPYTHRCTICGRTDVTDPDLEFRYCSRCNGYHCYCEDHINNHPHIEE